MTQDQWNSLGNIVMFKLDDSESAKFLRKYYHFETWWLRIIEIPEQAEQLIARSNDFVEKPKNGGRQNN